MAYSYPSLRLFYTELQVPIKCTVYTDGLSFATFKSVIKSCMYYLFNSLSCIRAYYVVHVLFRSSFPFFMSFKVNTMYSVQHRNNLKFVNCKTTLPLIVGKTLEKAILNSIDYLRNGWTEGGPW